MYSCILKGKVKQTLAIQADMVCQYTLVEKRKQNLTDINKKHQETYMQFNWSFKKTFPAPLQQELC